MLLYLTYNAQAEGYLRDAQLVDTAVYPARRHRRMVAPRAQAAPTFPGAQPEHVWSRELASGRPKV